MRYTNGKKILYFDVETTGKNPYRHDIIQLAGIIEVGGEIKEKFNFKVRPQNLDTVDSEALAINGHNLEEIKDFPDSTEVLQKLTAKFIKYIDPYRKEDKFYPAGYNVRFDLEFLHAFFKKHEHPYFGSYCNWKTIDALPLLHLLDSMGLLSLPDYKLATACQRYGIELKAHDAESDVTASYELLKKLKNLLFNRREV